MEFEISTSLTSKLSSGNSTPAYSNFSYFTILTVHSPVSGERASPPAPGM